MRKIDCVIADDEPLALQLLENLLRPVEDIHIVSVCANGNEALKSIQEFEPELVFLDIEMPGLNGFDVVKRLQSEVMPLVIFTTAFNQYAIKAFDIHAVDYLLKPLNSKRLNLAIARARARLQNEEYFQEASKVSIMGSIDKLTNNPAEQLPSGSPQGREYEAAPPGRTLLIRDSGKTHVIEQETIDWIDAAGDYMCVHVGSRTFVARVTMKKLEEQLDENQFVRIHRSTMVNISKIKQIQNAGKGDNIINLEGGVRLRVSRRYRAHLLDRLS